jgi:hypothetical protein
VSFNIGHVDGGTGAGKKRSLLAAHQRWACDCPTNEETKLLFGGRPRPGWLVNCPECNKRRPT